MEEFNGFNYTDENSFENAKPQTENPVEEIKETSKESSETLIPPAEIQSENESQNGEISQECENETVIENKSEVETKSENSADSEFVFPYHPVNYTAVKPETDHKPMSRGLKFFTLLIVAVIALTSACAGGYFLGKNSKNSTVTVGLEAKPKTGDELTAAQVYEKVNPSVVGICVYNSSGIGANASGVIYSKDGYIITNDHIYSEVGAAKFKIYTYDGKEYDADYVAGDKVSDLAVLKIKNGTFTPAVLGNSEQIIFGENVVAIGRPGGASDSSSITKGIISATSRRVQTTSNYSSRLIETDSPINPGSSGGALVNMYGQVIGITSSKLASSEVDAIGYAIPTTTVNRIVKELINSGTVLTRAKLGITYNAIDSVTADVGNYKYVGLYVDSVSSDSDLYGKISKGDIITHINGTEITSDEVVLDIIEAAKAGDEIQVTYVTGNAQSKTISAVLKANVGESSYTQEEKSANSSSSDKYNNGGSFDFPFGE